MTQTLLPVLNIYQDWNYIESSFMFDYNIDLVDSQMTFRRFYVLLSNISPESPLGRLITLRKTPNKDLSKEQIQLKKQLAVKTRKEDLKPSSEFQKIFQNLKTKRGD